MYKYGGVVGCTRISQQKNLRLVRYVGPSYNLKLPSLEIFKFTTYIHEAQFIICLLAQKPLPLQTTTMYARNIRCLLLLNVYVNIHFSVTELLLLLLLYLMRYSFLLKRKALLNR